MIFFSDVLLWFCRHQFLHTLLNCTLLGWLSSACTWLLPMKRLHLSHWCGFLIKRKCLWDDYAFDFLLINFSFFFRRIDFNKMHIIVMSMISRLQFVLIEPFMWKIALFILEHTLHSFHVVDTTLTPTSISVCVAHRTLHDDESVCRCTSALHTILPKLLCLKIETIDSKTSKT